MEFDRTFSLLKKFTIGLPPTPKSTDDVIAVAKYIGVELHAANLNRQIEFLTDELQQQNEFLNLAIASNSIFDSEQYKRSLFVREVVANNRTNQRRKCQRDR